MMEIAAAVSVATRAFASIKLALENGKEVHETLSYFTQWFDAKDAIVEADQNNKNSSIVTKLFSGNSIEAQALEIVSARHRMLELDKELREYLIYTGQIAFYEDMMRERRAIRQARMKQAQERAERKKLVQDMMAVTAGMGIAILIFMGLFAIIL